MIINDYKLTITIIKPMQSLSAGLERQKHSISFSCSKGSLSEMNPQTETGVASIRRTKKSPVDTTPPLSLPCAPNQAPLKRGTGGLKRVFLDVLGFLSSFLFLAKAFHYNEI